MVGTEPLAECLRKGLLHRAVAVLVLRSSGAVLLQQRSKADLWQPGLWTLSCTGHIRSGEAYRAAAARELQEELGLRSTLQARGKFSLPPFTDGKLTEHEWVALFTTKTDAQVAIDPVELESVREVSVSQLREIVSGGLLTQDAKILLGEYLSAEARQKPRSS